MGTSVPGILVRHLLPNVAGPVIVQVSLAFGTAVLIQSSLGFLGLGPEPPAPNWDGMIAEASSHLYLEPWLMVPAGVMLALAALATNLLGDALRSQELHRRKPSALLLASAVSDRPNTQSVPQRSTALEIIGLSISYDSGENPKPVVSGVDISVNAGEIVAVVGESGSGKTTSGLATLGILPHPARMIGGDVRVHGVGTLIDRSEAELQHIRGSEIAMIFQEPTVALGPCYTVNDQLLRPIMRHRSAPKEEAHKTARELLEHVGIPDPDRVLKQYPHEMSGGWRNGCASRWL